VKSSSCNFSTVGPQGCLSVTATETTFLELEQKLQRQPTDEEVAQAMERLAKARRKLKQVDRPDN